MEDGIKCLKTAVELDPYSANTYKGLAFMESQKYAK